MVHALAHTPRLQLGQLRERPDGLRIVALSGALAVNAAALLLLLMPVAAPDPAPLPDPPLVVYPDLQRSRPIPVVPIQVPVTKPQPRTPVVVPQPQPVIAPQDVPVLIAEGSEPATPPASDPVVEPSVEPATGQVAAVRLEYAHAPPPAYPREALRAGLQGTVMLQVLVGTDGRPLEVQIAQGSGHRQLDEAARRHVLKRWSFRPAMRDGRPVQAIGLVPVAFSLDR